MNTETLVSYATLVRFSPSSRKFTFLTSEGDTLGSFETKDAAYRELIVLYMRNMILPSLMMKLFAQVVKSKQIPLVPQVFRFTSFEQLGTIAEETERYARNASKYHKFLKEFMVHLYPYIQCEECQLPLFWKDDRLSTRHSPRGFILTAPPRLVKKDNGIHIVPTDRELTNCRQAMEYNYTLLKEGIVPYDHFFEQIKDDISLSGLPLYDHQVTTNHLS